MAATISFGRPSTRGICSIFSQCIESNALEKSTNNSDASIFLHELLIFEGLSEFVILWINYSENQYDSMLLSSRALLILAAMEVRFIPQ